MNYFCRNRLGSACTDTRVKMLVDCRHSKQTGKSYISINLIFPRFQFLICVSLIAYSPFNFLWIIVNDFFNKCVNKVIKQNACLNLTNLFFTLMKTKDNHRFLRAFGIAYKKTSSKWNWTDYIDFHHVCKELKGLRHKG